MQAIVKMAAGVVVLSAVAVLARQGIGKAQDAAPQQSQQPAFTQDGKLIRPTGYEEWVMVGASTGLSYVQSRTPPVAGAAPGMFHNVYLQPWAYRYAMDHRALPENAMFVLTFYEASRKSNPARAGFYEGDRMSGFEVHLKRKGVDSTGWGFYGFGSDTTASAAKLPGSAPCYACHKTEAAFDNAFAQFYPALRARLLQKPDSELRSAP